MLHHDAELLFSFWMTALKSCLITGQHPPAKRLQGHMHCHQAIHLQPRKMNKFRLVTSMLL